MFHRYSRAAVLCSVFIVSLPLLAQEARVARPQRFDLLEQDGMYAIMPSETGRYARPEDVPETVRKAMKAAALKTKSSSPVQRTAISFVVSDPSDAADSDINDIVYDPPTLRSAIQNANKLGGSHSITFSSGLTVIQPATVLPSVTASISIDGTVAAGKIILDGALIASGTGLLLASNNVVQNISFQNWLGGSALALGVGSTNNVVKRNEFKNNKWGLNVNSTNSTIGGPDPEDRNVSGGNTQMGISLVSTTDVTVQNNWCGTLDGVTKTPNTWEGLYVNGTRTRVLNNLLSGNNDVGLGISEFSQNTLVKDNIVGLDSSGTLPLGNASGGIEVMGYQDSILSNVVSDNGWGITVAWQAEGTLIRGNIIGPNKTLDSIRANRYGGIQLSGAPVTVDSNIISGNLNYGVYISGYGNATITRNMIGVDPTGTLDWGNGGPGINILADNNIIGGPNPSDRNIISGNLWGGIEMYGGQQLVFGGPPAYNWVQGNVIQNNLIGTDITGTVRIPNFTGLFMNGYVDSNFVRNNLISGNYNHGIWTRRSPNAPSRNTFTGNKIGTQADGLSPLPNDSTGFMIDSAQSNIFGGPNEGDGNIVAFSNQNGMTIKAGWGMQILRNSFFENKGLAIDLGNDGPTTNDSADTDAGANKSQNYPRITWIGSDGGSTTVKGRMQSKPLTSYRLEFYTNDEADSSGFGEGQTFQVTTDVVTDTAGIAPFEVIVPGSHWRVVGTATEAVDGTSEISKAPFVVNSVADRSDANPFDGLASTSGPQVNGAPEVTLRSALQASDDVEGEDDISFNIPGAGAQFILPQSPLPIAQFDVTIDGSTQPGYAQGAVQVIQVLGTNAGPSANGLRFAGDNSTMKAVYLSGFQQNGIDATGDLLTLIDVTSNANKKIGVDASHNLTLEGESIFSGNGPAAPSSAACYGSEGAGIQVGDMLRGTGKVVASGNCGPGIKLTGAGFYNAGIFLDARVTASNNAGDGIRSDADVFLKGERFEFNANGFPKKPADGVRAGLGDITIEATEAGTSPNIFVNANSSNGITSDNGAITLKGRAQVNNNGAGLSKVEAFNRKITGIMAERDVRTQDVEVKANGLDGIKARGSIIVEGNAVASDHPGRGLWGVINITLDGTEHLVENNLDGAIWAANGFLNVKGTLIARNNTVGGHHGEEESPERTNAKVGAVEGYKYVSTEGLLFEDNTPTAISSWGSMTIRGNAVVKRSKVTGIYAQMSLLIEGAEHNVSGNGGDGLASFNGTLVVRGNMLLEGNGGLEPGEGFGAAGQRIEMDNVTARGNSQGGLFGIQELLIRGTGIIIGNQKSGAASQGLVTIPGGRVCDNGGYGIQAPRVRISGTQICNNTLGGVSGTIESVPAARIFGNDDSRSGAVNATLNGVLQDQQINYISSLRSLRRREISSSELALLPPPLLASSIIRGSSVTNNGGSGILVDSPYPFVIEGSNISGNTGFGVINEGLGDVVANQNWWGSGAGPGGAVSGTVEAGSWQPSSVGLYIGAAADSIYVLPGDTGTISIVAADWSAPGDSITIDASDTRGWLTPVSGLTVPQKDSIPAVVALSYGIPEGVAAGDSARVVVAGSGNLSPGTVEDTIVVIVYTPTLSEILVLSDTLIAAPGDTVQITAAGFDQAGREAAFVPYWTATGGSVDSTGLFVAGMETGVFVVHVTDTVAGLSDSTYIRIVAPQGPAAPGIVELTLASLDAGPVLPGEQSLTSFSVTNTSGGIVTIDSIRTLTPYFTVAWDPLVNQLRVGDTLTVGVVFTPDSIRGYMDTLYLYSNSPDSILVLALTGNGTTTGVSEDAVIPVEYVLNQNYPNPFNPSTTIRYGLPFASRVTLRVYDILGREVMRLVDGVMEAGFQTVEWRNGGASGVYFYRIEAASIADQDRKFVKVMRMVVVK